MSKRFLHLCTGFAKIPNRFRNTFQYVKQISKAPRRFPKMFKDSQKPTTNPKLPRRFRMISNDSQIFPLDIKKFYKRCQALIARISSINGTRRLSAVQSLSTVSYLLLHSVYYRAAVYQPRAQALRPAPGERVHRRNFADPRAHDSPYYVHGLSSAFRRNPELSGWLSPNIPR